MNLVANSIRESILDTIFPKHCVGCGKLDTYLCELCTQKITLIKSPTCLGCGKLSPKGKFCPNCRKKTDLTGIIIAAHYEEGPLKEAIHTFKYDFIFDLKEKLSTFLADALKRDDVTKNIVLTYVPLHKKKENWRGFNQSRLLAEELSKMLGLELIDDLICRNRNTPTQIELKRKERFSNVIDAFQANTTNMNNVIGKKIILVDDIVTTGATMSECAKELRKLKAKEVWGLVLGKH